MSLLEYSEITEKKFIVMDGAPFEVISAHVFRKQQRKPVNATKLKNLITGKVTELNVRVISGETALNAVAGMAAWTGAGNWLYGSQINGLLARNGRDPGNTVDLALGAQAAPGTYIEMRNATTGYPVRLKHDAAKDQLVTDVANLGSAVTGRTGPPLPGWPRGSVMVPPTQYFSSGGQTIRLGYGVTDPPLPDATWPAGSRWERISASATGAPRTWVLGADGAWRVVEAVQ